MGTLTSVHGVLWRREISLAIDESSCGVLDMTKDRDVTVDRVESRNGSHFFEDDGLLGGNSNTGSI
jgi:hypothetical protein